MIASLKRIGTLISLAFASLFFVLPAMAAAPGSAAPVPATLYQNPACQSCTGYAKYLGQHGFNVRVVNASNVRWLEQKHGVPSYLAGDSLLLVGGYAVSGAVPANVVNNLLQNREPIAGVTTPSTSADAAHADPAATTTQDPPAVYGFGIKAPGVFYSSGYGASPWLLQTN
ncbi:MAG TPA: DUF411 domain-containing protein [Nevskiaceae bacterium]